MIRTKRLFQVFAPRRSGHHAVMWWIRAQLIPPAERLNNRRLPLRIQPGGVKWYDDNARPLLNALIANYEDKDPFRVYQLSHEQGVSVVQGVEAAQTRYLIILRDPFNNLASKKKANPERGLDAGRREARHWKALAREYLGITSYLPDKTAISYNRWFQDRSYRLQLAAELDLDFDDDHPQAKQAMGAVPGAYGKSQFDGRKFDGRAQEMDVMNRWREFQDDPDFRELFRDEELLQLAGQIFEVEGIERFLARI